MQPSPPHPGLSLPPPAFSMLQKYNLLLRKQTKPTPFQVFFPSNSYTSISFQPHFPLSFSTASLLDHEMVLPDAPFFLIMGRGRRNKLKTHLNTVLAARLAGTRMTLDIIAIYLYCLHSFQTPAKQQPAAPEVALMPLTEPCAETHQPEFPRNPSIFQKATSDISSGQGQELYEKLISISNPLHFLLYFIYLHQAQPDSKGDLLPQLLCRESVCQKQNSKVLLESV